MFNLTYLPSEIICGFGLILNPGTSVCAPISLRPVSSISPVPTSKAIKAESFFTT